MKPDEGSTIPLILGFLLIAFVMTAGGVAAGDAFVQQNNLQNVCDGAALVAASSADTDSQRRDGPAGGGYLRLAKVQQSVLAYLSREAGRADIEADVVLSADTTTVTVRCERHSGIAFGPFFGFGAGIHHRATASAHAPQTR